MPARLKSKRSMSTGFDGILNTLADGSARYTWTELEQVADAPDDDRSTPALKRLAAIALCECRAGGKVGLGWLDLIITRTEGRIPLAIKHEVGAVNVKRIELVSGPAVDLATISEPGRLALPNFSPLDDDDEPMPDGSGD